MINKRKKGFKRFTTILIAALYLTSLSQAKAAEFDEGYTDYGRQVDIMRVGTPTAATSYIPQKTNVFESIDNNSENNIEFTQESNEFNYNFVPDQNTGLFTLNTSTPQVYEDKEAIYINSEGNSINLDTGDNNTITINKDIRSISTSNTLNLRGNGNIVFNNVVDPVVINNNNQMTVHNNYLDDVIYNLNGGMVSVTKDEYLNGLGHKNTLNFNGGALNLANKSIGSVDLGALNINATSNIYLDADLAKEKMDTITADSVTAANGAYLNVAAIQLLSDAKKNVTEINAINPNLKTTSGETLASKITSSAKVTAYSPIFKYTIEYNKNNGNFRFTRGTTSLYNNINPALMSEAVATQIGGYLGMLETYSNAFANMDYHMMQNANLRNTPKLENRYAISDSTDLRYFSGKSNSGGVYFRPYTSYDSISMHNGPSVRSFSYGAFIGGDTELHETKTGWVRGLSPHISYLGSHQTYSGNTIYQNGANIGLTGMLYKNNFFTGLTYNAAISAASVTTPYRNDEFPVFATGIASKTGYNFETRKGRFVIQPSLLVSYTFVNTFDDETNILGMNLKTDPLNVVQIQPSLRLIMNTKHDWHPYIGVDVNVNLGDKSKVNLGGYNLPQISIDPYVQYAIGIQKTIPDVMTCYLQMLARSGGRNGFAATGGLKMFIYKDTKRTPYKSDKV